MRAYPASVVPVETLLELGRLWVSCGRSTDGGRRCLLTGLCAPSGSPGSLSPDCSGLAEDFPSQHLWP